MRVAIEGDGFGAGVDVCLNANQVAVLLAESLSGKLSSLAGMAGDDASSAVFASSYDRAAASVVTTLGDLAEAFAGLGWRVALTGERHRAAEEAAQLGAPVVFDGESMGDDYLTRAAGEPPSALGANPAGFGLSAEQRWILDHVEGFVWPGADLGRLRDAAQMWGSTADQVEDLAVYCELLVAQLQRQRSPEIPVAIDAVTELHRLIQTVAVQAAALGESCETYAARVEAAHASVRELLGEIVVMIVEGVLIGAVVSAVTAGVGAGAATGATIARIVAQSPRFAQVLATLRTMSALAGSRARYVGEALDEVRAGLRRFVRKRTSQMDERGSLDWSVTPLREVLLRGFERMGGHTLDRHVAKSVEHLADRARRRGLGFASSFRSQVEAEAIIARVIGRQSDKIQWWLHTSPDEQLVLREVLGNTGISVDRGGVVHAADGARVVLKSDRRSDTGWRIVTAFPEP